MQSEAVLIPGPEYAHAIAPVSSVHVVVVAYHAAALLEEALRPLHGSWPLTVVDNSASSEVQDVCRRRGACYVDSGGNLGFAGGVNVALRRLLAGEPTHVLLLNPDAVLQPGDLDALVAHLALPPNGDVAAVSPRLLEPGGVEQRAAWPFPTPGRAWLEAAGLGRLNRSADFLIGATLLLRWEALLQVGLFDERFFLYAEEADWQRRAAILGWRVAMVPGAVARHVGAGTSSDPLRRERLFQAGTETYVRKWSGAAGWASYRTAALCGALVRWVVLPADRGRAARRRARILAVGPRRAAGLA